MDSTTILEAVNDILSSVGRTPVTTLIDAGTDVTIAERILRSESRKIQTKGWHWNTDVDVPLTPDGNGEIHTPNNAVKVDICKLTYSDVNPVQRGNRLYDTRNRTYVFKSELKATIVYLLNFEDMPEVARQYITCRAGRVYQDKYYGDMESAAFTREDEAEAKANLFAHEIDNSDLNIFQNRFSQKILTPPFR